MLIHPPYTYATLVTELQTHQDLVTAVSKQVYNIDPTCTWRTWARARTRARMNNSVAAALHHRAMCWSCYLHPATTDELTEHFREMVAGWGTATMAELQTVLRIEQELARPSSIHLVCAVFLDDTDDAYDYGTFYSLLTKTW